MAEFKPFVGLPLWYWPGHEDSIGESADRPLAATVTGLLESGKLNLSVFDFKGRLHSREGVRFFADGGAADDDKSYCGLRPDQLDYPPEPPEGAITDLYLPDLPEEDDTDLHEDEEPVGAKTKTKRGKKR